MSSADAPSIAFQKSIVNTGLNSAVLLAFLMVTRRASQRLLVAGAMSFMWILAMMLLGSIWFGMNWCIVVHGDTREDIASCGLPRWIILLQDLAEFPIIVVADGLLVWRCFHIWNRSLRATAIPLFLTVVEVGSFLAAIIAISVDRFAPNPKQTRAYNSLLAAAFLLSFASTLVTTLLIGYRIWSFSHQRITSMGRYKHVVEILVQSSAVYAVAMVVQAIQGFLPNSFNFKHPTREWALQNYTVTIVFPIACIAPTIMVARVALLDNSKLQTSTTRVLSDLQFQLGSTRLEDTRTRLDTGIELDGVSNLASVEKNSS